MKMQEIRNQLITLKIHLDQVDNWVRQGAYMIDKIEEKLFDIEDEQRYQKYEVGNNIEFLKDAAAGIYNLIDSPPRLTPSRHGNDNIAAKGFYQSDFDLEKII